MTNPSVWLSIVGAIYALSYKSTGWFFFCVIICVASIVYNCLLADKHSTEKALAAQTVLTFADGYITRMIPALNMFFNMRTNGRLIYEPIFREGAANEVRVDLDYDFLLANDVDNKTEALYQIVQSVFDTDFKIPDNFATCLRASVQDAKEANASTRIQALLLAAAKNPETLRPNALDVKRFNRAVFIVQFSVKGEPVACRTFHVNPNSKE